VRAQHLPPEEHVTPVPSQFPEGSGFSMDRQLIADSSDDADSEPDL
jgi:hypothetical protein